MRQQLTLPVSSHELLWGDDLERHERLARSANLRDAAVLVPIIDRPTGPTVLLTQRTAHLHDHAGQISFPGGRTEPEDANATATALRETHEEIGLDASAVEVLGTLPNYHTASGYRVAPVVGWSDPPATLALDSFEVAETFEIPLAFLLDARNQRQERAWVAGRERTYWAMPYRTPDGKRRFVWGVTAGIIVMLSRVLQR
jgi:8-oxo-dGTP pyrophosphatase MutT (NUDIX family)